MALLVIAGWEAPNPSDLQVGRFDITKSARTASGRMVMEVVRAGVRRLDVTWAQMADPDYQTLLRVLQTNKPFFSVTYEDAGGPETMTCYVGDIAARAWHRVNGVRYWSDVSMAFIEQ